MAVLVTQLSGPKTAGACGDINAWWSEPNRHESRSMPGTDTQGSRRCVGSVRIPIIEKIGTSISHSSKVELLTDRLLRSPSHMIRAIGIWPQGA